ncbi:hypothetical protein OCGS_0078 [Oceaniovalibus guishaninsula JLT2003]|uniref:Uncharacterized protein n=1 Tax=Oceaniovalibus guishaninsula JLT2003 TaxID=1231392 RepID=K2HHE6_9RHOB|nr:DUF6476 family protein [Oceaniovalibus guishaninsula]EKE45852.1 hypothetical protein OCGS_0078 [Oceaniovalibus guishaninsula JLT2003]
MVDISSPDRGLVLLKWLVTGLTATMMIGLVVLIGLFVTRFPDNAPSLPASLTLPKGEKAMAVTMGTGWIAVVTESDEILIYPPDGGRIVQRVTIQTEN